MAEFMKTPQTPTVNLLEFAENAFTEEVDIDIHGKSSYRYACNICDFKNSDKGGMKRHIHARHRLGGLKRQELDDNHDDNDGMKQKSEEFNPNITSTQKPKLNLTVSAYSNESLLNLLDDKYEFNDEMADMVPPSLDETATDGQNDAVAVEDAVLGADFALLSQPNSNPT